MTLRVRHKKIIGRLASGLGMGVSFTQLAWVRTQFSERLGFEPYPGTLNVIVDEPYTIPVWIRLKRTEGIPMENPNNGPHDCDAKCWLVSIGDEIDAAIVLPLIEDYPPAQVEVVAPVGLRATLGIEDGDRVILTLKT